MLGQEQYDRIMRNAPDYQPSYFSREGSGKDKVFGFQDTRQLPRESVGWEDIQEFCRTRLASFKRPEHLEFLDALPKNALGKILRKELHAREKGETP